MKYVLLSHARVFLNGINPNVIVMWKLVVSTTRFARPIAFWTHDALTNVGLKSAK